MPNLVALRKVTEHGVIQKTVCVGEQARFAYSSVCAPSIFQYSARSVRRSSDETKSGGAAMTCKRCKVTMKELKGHIFHKKRKWRCPQCQKIKMQKPKSKAQTNGEQ
jgi:hypothetical protein